MDLRGDNGGTEGGGMPGRASRDGLSFASPTSITRLGKYDIIARLGQGGMAGVFLAVARGAVEDVRKLVVLKVLHEGLRHQDEYIEMFKREAKIAVDLAHPNVVNTYTVGQEDGQYCIVMEYLDGVPLSALLKTASGWSLEQRLPLLGALCLILSGLHYVHGVRDIDGNELQLVHRDLKPANILIGFDGQAKLLDFGVAKMTAPEAEQTQGLSIKGTMQYVAPEGLDPKQPIDRRYDVFAAGLVLWEIATGRRFWADHDHMQILRGLGDDQMSRILDEDKSLPAMLKQAIRRALAPSPDDRQATALELKRDIQSYLVSVGFRIDTDQLAAIVTDAFGDMQLQRRGVISRNLRVLRERRSAAAGAETTDQPGKSQAIVPPAPSSSIDSSTDVALASSSQTALGEGPDSMNATKPNSSEPPRRGLIAAAIALPLFAGVAYAAFGTDTDARTAPRAVATADG
ncbi:MAG: serine/threonine protein kinase, partial [Nannocystaceae bacterium]|nr:serine/threonine protein kinase [Nannocystaceae bacterium]